MRSSSSTLRTTEAELEGSTRRTTLMPGQEIPGIVQGDSLLAYPTAAVRHRQQRVTLSHWPIVNSPEAKSVFRKFVSSLTIETMQAETGRQVAVALYVVAMVAVIVGLDVAFFRNRFWERLIANIGVVLVFVAFYLRFRAK
jgi:hypothetical protein